MAFASLLSGAARQCLLSSRLHSQRSATVTQAFALLQFQQTSNKQPLHTLSSPNNTVVSKLPAKTPQISLIRCSSGGNHVRLWTAERALSVALLGVIPLAVVYPTPAVETLLALSMTLHSHWGIEALVHDYVRPSVFGKYIPMLAEWSVYTLSIVTFGSLCYFINFDVGLINAVHMLWSL